MANGVKAKNTAALEVANSPKDVDTTVQEVANDLCLVLEDTIVLPTFVKKRKQDALHISILLEASFIKDIDVLLTQKTKCQCIRGCNITFHINFYLFHIHCIIDTNIPLYIFVRLGGHGWLGEGFNFC